MRNGKYIVDFHAHVEYVNGMERMLPKDFLSLMDTAGVDVSVVLGGDQGDSGSMPPWIDSEEIAVPTNFSDEEVARFCAECPQRLIGFASVHPDRHRPDKKIRRAIEELGLKGVKLYPHSGFYPNEKRLDVAYKTCEELEIPVMIHTGIKAVRWQSMMYNRPICVDEVATRFPRLQIVMCHAGFPWYDEFLAVAYSNPNVWVDITFIDYIERAFRRPGFAEHAVREICSVVGVERVLWGSEGPVMDLPLFGRHGPENYERSIEMLVEKMHFLSEDGKAALLGQNARRLLGI